MVGLEQSIEEDRRGEKVEEEKRQEERRGEIRREKDRREFWTRCQPISYQVRRGQGIVVEK